MRSIFKLWRKLRDKEYRDGYTESQLSIEVPFQIRAIRKARGWTQAQLAERSGIPQARISHLEQAGRDPLSLRTLYRLAAAFDVGLLVQFVSFSELVRREAAFDPETFRVPSFAEDHVERAAPTSDALVTTESCATHLKLEFTVQVPAETVSVIPAQAGIQPVSLRRNHQSFQTASQDLFLQAPETQARNAILASTEPSTDWATERTPL